MLSQTRLQRGARPHRRHNVAVNHRLRLCPSANLLLERWPAMEHATADARNEERLLSNDLIQDRAPRHGRMWAMLATCSGARYRQRHGCACEEQVRTPGSTSQPR